MKTPKGLSEAIHRRTYNTMANKKKTSDQQNTTQKTKD
jgi:hypothetical protein